MKKISTKFKFLLLNFVLAIGLICGIVIFTLYQLDNYTQHGSFIAVPSFEGMTIQEAHAAALQARLKVQIIDSIYAEDVKPGSVVEQYPASGSRVKENRIIHLTLNAQNPERVAIPNLQNAAYRQTLQTLEARGFNIGHIEYDTSEFKNLVLNLKYNGETILPGSMLRKGSTIDIVLGQGEGSNTVYVPLLAGKTLREAIDIIRKSYLNIEEIIPDGSISKQTDKYSAIIYQQYPEINEIVEAGTPMKLYITLEEKKITALDSLIVTE